MSIGPQEKPEEQIKVSFSKKTAFIAKKVINSYFEKPLYYTLYIGLDALIIGLLLGYSFHWTLYALIGALAAVEGYKHFIPKIEINGTKG